MKFSIVVPSYNQAEYLPRTLDSILSQAGDFEIECLVMDGGSRDASPEILAEYGRRVAGGEYPVSCRGVTFDYVSEKDRGQTHAINKGLERATGDLLAYINSDDTYAPGAFALVAERFAGRPDALWCHGRCEVIDTADRPIRGAITRYKDFLCRRYSYGLLLSCNPISQMTVFWTRRAYATAGTFAEEESLCMDYEYWLRLGSLADPEYLDAHLANFRFYPTTKSATRFREQFDREYELAKRYARGKHRLRLAVHALHSRSVVAAYGLLSRLGR